MATAGPSSFSGPNWARLERKTKGGRTLHYVLEIIQQPERARACGSGPKSSADRRPVDPPPVLQMKVFEGDTWETRKDITFDYKANFFIFTSLEHARPMAHGRVQTPAATTPPVLTGVPVGGACYLDRPDPACYFLFPDLSVRHEGLYRLSFCMWEDTLEERDHDLHEPEDDAELGYANMSPTGQYFKSRMEVKSEPFNVYSAKKFPGLTQSTSLSRTIAEQGCRVRIRRDVRMRKRDGKNGGPPNHDDEQQFSRHQTPIYRARSGSNASMDRASYHGEPRRLSVADPVPQPYYAAPPTGPTYQGYPSEVHHGYSQALPPPPPPAAPSSIAPAYPSQVPKLPAQPAALAPVYNPRPPMDHKRYSIQQAPPLLAAEAPSPNTAVLPAVDHRAERIGSLPTLPPLSVATQALSEPSPVRASRIDAYVQNHPSSYRSGFSFAEPEGRTYKAMKRGAEPVDEESLKRGSRPEQPEPLEIDRSLSHVDVRSALSYPRANGSMMSRFLHTALQQEYEPYPRR